ncbi:MAG: oxygenase MpaB family protein [Xanthobacteraceae bacterium]
MRFAVANTPIVLPWPLQGSFETATRALLDPGDQSSVDFSRPAGEHALVSPESVSWRVFKNPVSLFIGGVAAVIMELAEPRVRTGVWEHTTFRVDPIRRLRRTGLAAMVTVYGARSTAEAMIAHVRRMHDKVAGMTSSGEYCANDPELLNWVHGTAAYGFVQAYHAYVRPLSLQERNCYYAEGITAAALYGAISAPASEAELEILFEATAGRLERSDVVFEFLAIMRSAPILPLLLRPVQHLLVRAAIDLTPRWLQTILGLNGYGVRRWEAELIRQAGAFADRLVLETSPAVQACRRVRLPAQYLYHTTAAPARTGPPR